VSPRTATDLAEAGLPTVTASATNAVQNNGWATFHRMLANDAVQAQAARTSDTLGQKARHR
jgi:hypothetical protein